MAALVIGLAAALPILSGGRAAPPVCASQRLTRWNKYRTRARCGSEKFFSPYGGGSPQNALIPAQPAFPCYAFTVGRAIRSIDKPLQEVDNVQRGEGMNASELQKLKAALLKAERLEVLAILRDAENLNEAIKILEQWKKG